MSSEELYIGVDVGASRTKVAVLDGKKILLGYSVRKSGTNFSETAEVCLKDSLEMAGTSKDRIRHTISTGYGRNNVEFSEDYKTEISCHAKGCYHYFPFDITVIDIGGQDNKIIKLNRDGRRLNFKMNRKCAAGTGAFLEEMSLRLDIPIEEMNGYAEKAENMIKLGSYCTVFSATEVLENIRKGANVADIVKGLFFSVVKRVLEMDSLTQRVVMTGGVVAHNLHLVEMTREMTGKEILVPELPQLTGAIGAALHAIEKK